MNRMPCSLAPFLGIVALGTSLAFGGDLPSFKAAVPDQGLPVVDLNAPLPGSQPLPMPPKVAPPPVQAPAPAPVPTASADPWSVPPGGGASIDLKGGAKISQQPPFVVTVSSRAIDLSRIWWSPELLSLRIGKPSVTDDGAVLPWRRSPAGYPAIVLSARIPTIEHREIFIRQAFSMVWLDDSWMAEGSSMEVLLRGGEREEKLVSPADGLGLWRVRMYPSDSIEVWRWVAAALNGCRTALSEKLGDEELRQVLIRSGEVVWRISPARTQG